MLCNRQSDHPLHLITDTNVTICFQHRFFNITRLQSLIHSIQLNNTHLQESLFLFFLIVHHKEGFHSMQHKVICKLSLTIVCGSPILLPSLHAGQPVRSTSTRLIMIGKSLPSFVQHPCPYNWTWFKTHTLVHKQWRVFEACHCPTTPNVI